MPELDYTGEPIKVTVTVALDNFTLASALIDATFDGDVAEARGLTSDERSRRLREMGDQLELDGLVRYATDFATSTDLDEHHAVWGNEVHGAEDMAVEIVMELRKEKQK